MRRAEATGAAIGGGLAFLVAGIRTGADGTELMRLVILGVALGAASATDLAEHRIPNRIVAPAAIACAVLLVAQAVPPQQLLGGIALVALILGISLARPASFGMGDVKLALLLVLGLAGLAAQAIVLGLALAAVFGAALLVRHGRSGAGRPLPLAPFLSGAAVVVLL